MRVLLTADTVGGVWTYARELVTGLVAARRSGHAGELWPHAGTSPAGMDGRSAQLRFSSHRFRLEWMQDSAEDIAASSEYLLNVIRETQSRSSAPQPVCYGALED